VGALYLPVLGIRSVFGAGAVGESAAKLKRVSDRRAYLHGLLTNLLNPKMITFTIALLPQFVDRRAGSLALQFVILGAIFIVLELVVDGTVALLSGHIGRLMSKRRATRRFIEIATGFVFFGLAARLALER